MEHRESLRACTCCGVANSGANRFCVSCGAPLPAVNGAAQRSSPRVTAVAPPTRAPVSERATSTARLTTIAEDGSEGVSYPLAYDQIDLGRQEGELVLGEDPYLSPRHARFSRRAEAWYVRDLESLNGVFVRLTAASPLVDGDLLLVGLQVLKFQLVNSAEQALGPAAQHGTLVFGSPAVPRYARLSQRTVEGVTRNVFYLHKDETTIGRESGDIVFSDDPFLSRRHLLLRRNAPKGGFTAEDCGSSNGTYLAIRGETRLEHGAQLRMGQHLFRFDLDHPSLAVEGSRRLA